MAPPFVAHIFAWMQNGVLIVTEIIYDELKYSVFNDVIAGNRKSYVNKATDQFHAIQIMYGVCDARIRFRDAESRFCEAISGHSSYGRLIGPSTR